MVYIKQGLKMNRIKSWLQKVLRERWTIFHFLNVFLLAVSFTIPFISGSFSSDSKKEELSNYIAERVKDSTLGKALLAVSITTTSDSGSLPRDEDEFKALYGIFRQENITFASGYNLNKEINISIPDLNDNKNYSIFYNAKDENVEYNGHYKHWYYPIEYMFDAQRLYNISHYMIYLTKGQADILLENKGTPKNEDNEYDEDNYRSLIKEQIIVNVDGKDVNCVIGNIIYEQNYYYKGLKEVLNDFIACAYYCPGDLQRESIYFFNNYSYQNTYFMNYIKHTYSNNPYNISILRNNVTNVFDFDYVTSFYKNDFEGNNTIYVLLIVISIFLLSVVSLINFLKCSKLSFKYITLSLIAIFLPYLVFFIIYHITHSILLFSNAGITLFVYLLAYYVVVQLVLFSVNTIYNNNLKRRLINAKDN